MKQDKKEIIGLVIGCTIAVIISIIGVGFLLAGIHTFDCEPKNCIETIELHELTSEIPIKKLPMNTIDYLCTSEIKITDLRENSGGCEGCNLWIEGQGTCAIKLNIC